MTTILIADDHPVVLEGLSALLHGSGFSVVAKCTNGIEVLDALERVQPDIVLLDINMPRPSGLEILKHMKDAGIPSRIVLITSSIDDSQAVEAVRLGVHGILLKEAAPQELMACLEVVRDGRQWFDSDIVKRAFAREEPTQSAEQLTARELDVVRLVARGLRNKEVARELGITEGTVKMYLHNIYEKLNVGSRFELANRVREKRLL